MEADFSGWATKNNIRCSDGRTIMDGAFAHQDKMKVPLVWQHQHDEPINTLGYAILEHRDQGIYTYGFFNDSDYGKHAKTLVKHGDIESLSIYANNLTQKGKNVMHGDIKEVSLVLSGANPGAVIDNPNIVHGDSMEPVIDEAVIYTGLSLEHSDFNAEELAIGQEAEEEQTADLDIPEVLESLNDDQREVFHHMISEALVHANKTGGTTTVADTATKEKTDSSDKSIAEIFDTLSDEQKQAVYYMIGAAVDDEGDGTAKHSDLDTDELIGQVSENIIKHMEEQGMGTTTRNVFEQNEKKDEKRSLSHAELKTIIDDTAKFGGSFKDSFMAHAAEYGIENIDVLFPDAQAASNNPELIARRTEWVQNVINGTKHSPFARVKSLAADLTAEEARAKGYVKGNLKKDEIVKMLKRVTTPTTIYKKQKLDRDDIIDITDLDVVAWLKTEMRAMLDEELARAVLVGDGRESDDEDAIDQDHIRPIAYDVDMYSHSITIANDLTGDTIVEAILRARRFYRGTGIPTLYTTDGVLTDLILQKDKVGRRLYATEQELAAALRVDSIVVVEAMEDNPDLVAIIVNLADYTLGADRGGDVSLFDDFDIDYNQFKYLIETRVSGALTKPKSALVIKRTVGISVTPTSPSYNGTTHKITIPTTAGVIYSIEGTDQTGDVTINETSEVEARPAQGYSFPPNTNRTWTFVYTA